MLDQIGNWIGDITGWNQAQRGKKDEESTERANAEAQRKAQEQYAQMQQFLGGVVGGGDPMQRAQQQYQQAFQASQQAGVQQAQMAAQQAASQARGQGLTAGQAAALAGRQTGQNYLAGQQQALGQFRGAQDAATSAQLQSAGMSAGLSVPGLQRQQGTDASGAVQGLMGGIGTLAGVGAGIVGGKYAKGTASVPKDMIAEIHEGEIIIPAKASEKIRAKAGTMDVKKLATMLDDALGIYKEGDK